MNKILSRRQIIGIGTIAALDVLVSGCAPTIKGIFTDTSPKITFENALADKDNSKELRQKYLKQLLAESLYGQYARSVIYDHDGMVVRNAVLEDIEKIINASNLAEYHASTMSGITTDY